MSTWWGRRSTALVGAALFVGSLAFYLSTMAPLVIVGDPGEYQFVPYVLGIAHPPGYGFYTLLGKLFVTLLPLGKIAWRMNLLSGVCGATLTVLAYGQTLHLTRGDWRSAAVQLPAILGAMAVGVGASFVQHASHANAHIVTATLAMVNALLLLRWQRTEEDRWLYAFAFTAGSSPTQHPLLVFGFPIYGLFILAVRPRLLRQWRKQLIMAGCALLGLMVYLYYPLRSASGAPFGPDNAHTWDGFWHLVLARGLTVNVFPFTIQEQLCRLGDVARLMRLQFAWPLFVLAAWGVLWLAARQRRALLLLGGYALVTVYITVNILQDALAYLLGPTVVMGVLIGAGGLALAEWLRRWPASERLRRPVAAVVSLALFALPVGAAIHNQPRVDLSDYRQADAFVDAVFEQFAGQGQGARLLCAWEQLTPLHYYRLVEGRSPDPQDVVIVAVSAGRQAPWAEAAWANLEAGPLYTAEYRAEIVQAGFRLEPEGHFYRLLTGPRAAGGPPIGHPLDISFDDGVFTLLGYDLNRSRLRAGESLRLTVYARLNRASAQVYMPFVRLGEAVEWRFTGDSKFLTPRWTAGEAVAQDYDLPVSSLVAPGAYTLRLGVQAASLSGETTLPLTTVQVDAPRFPPPLAAMRAALGNLGGRMLLSGATVRIAGQSYRAPWDAPLTAHAGDTVQVTLYWRCLRRMDESYKVSVQFEGPDLFNPRTQGPLWGQDDFWPVGGAFPTHLWIPKWVEGQQVADRHTFDIDPAAPPGDYLIAVGVYDTVGVRRLSTLDAQGNAQGDRLTLGAVRIAQ